MHCVTVGYPHLDNQLVILYRKSSFVDIHLRLPEVGIITPRNGSTYTLKIALGEFDIHTINSGKLMVVTSAVEIHIARLGLLKAKNRQDVIRLSFEGWEGDRNPNNSP